MTLPGRLMHRLRVCRDCLDGYRYADYPGTHCNPRYCAVCLPKRTRPCAICKVRFYPARDIDRLCPLHVVHPAWF